MKTGFLRVFGLILIQAFAADRIESFGGSNPTAAERGKIALTRRSFIAPTWSLDAYKNVRQFWNENAADPDKTPRAFAEEFQKRYGLHEPPYPNDGLPMGLRKATSRDGRKVGIQVDCLICHGGSIGGTTLIGLGNSTLDLRTLFEDLTHADGRQMPPELFTLTTTRGTVNAGQISVVLFSLRNSDLSRRIFPLRLHANLPELDTPAWWLLKKKRTQYYDGRTDARSVRANMQFLLGDLSLDRLKEIEPDFADILAYIKSIEAPRYPFPIDLDRANRGEAIFNKTCARCHGTYGANESYPNKIVDLDLIGTDPVRANELSDRFVAHYNSTWFGAIYPADPKANGYQAPPLDGVWATAPYLHNGSVPTLYHMLKSSERPARYRRPASTDFANYDPIRVGWKFEPVEKPIDPGLSRREARYIFDSSRRGLGNRGHTFGDKLSEKQRLEVVEYLKTL